MNAQQKEQAKVRRRIKAHFKKMKPYSVEDLMKKSEVEWPVNKQFSQAERTYYPEVVEK